MRFSPIVLGNIWISIHGLPTMSKSRPTTSQTQNTQSRRSELHTHTHMTYTLRWRCVYVMFLLVYIHALVPHPQSIFATTPFPPSYLRVGYPHGIQHIDVLAPYSFVFASFELYIMTKRPQYSSIQTNVICIYFILANHWSIRIYIFSGDSIARVSCRMWWRRGADETIYWERGRTAQSEWFQERAHSPIMCERRKLVNQCAVRAVWEMEIERARVCLWGFSRLQ